MSNNKNDMALKEVDLTRYPLTISSVIPYFKVFKEQEEYHFFEGAFGNNRFQYFKVAVNTHTVELYNKTINHSQTELSNSIELKLEREELFEWAKQEATLSKIGLPAYYLYWQHLSDTEKEFQSISTIPHYEALNEWYWIKRKKFIDTNKINFIDREVQDIETEKWKRELIQEIEKTYLIFKDESPSFKSKLITVVHAKELARFYKFLITGSGEICEVPYIMRLMDHKTISYSILDLFFYLVEQPVQKEAEDSNEYRYKNFSAPFQVSYYGAFPCMRHVTWLELQMESVNDSSGFFKHYTRENVYDGLREYAKGFQAGYDQFLTEKIENKDIFHSTEYDRLRAIYEYAINPENNLGFPEYHGPKRDHIFDWRQDGILGGYFYKAWYYILENADAFEPYFNNLELKQDITKDYSISSTEEKSDKVNESLNKIKNNKFVWPIIVGVVIFYGLIEFHEKVTSFWSELFPEKYTEPPVIEARMVIRHQNDSTINYDYEITNTGKGIAKNMTISEKDLIFTHISKMQPESNLSAMLDAGSSMIIQGNPNSIHITNEFAHQPCLLLVEYLDSMNHPKNCFFIFIINKENLKGSELKYTDRNCNDSLSVDNRMDIEFYNRNGKVRKD